MNNELFRLYLEEVNRIECDEAQKRFKKANKRFRAHIDIILVIVLVACAGIISFWAIIQEIAMKLR
jgi:hypothetical protein